MQVPLVSVEMITYNHAPYIRNAIERVLAQKTAFTFELVIGEDCSTDGTREIVMDFAARYQDIIRVITSGQNVGIRENANRTGRACRGKYVAYCEGDDFWHRDDKLQMQVAYLEEHPECGLVASDYNTFHPNSQLLVHNYRRTTTKLTVPNPDIIDILSGNANILTCTAVARRDLVQRLRDSDPYLYYSGTFKMGDTQLWAEISRNAEVYVLDESLATYQVLEESASQSNDRKKWLRFKISNSEMCLYLCDKHQLPSEIRRGHADDWTTKSLKLAFLEQNVVLAETVKGKSSSLSIKDWIWYWGTKQLAVRLVLRSILALLRKNV